jgi:hypothetical protein
VTERHNTIHSIIICNLFFLHSIKLGLDLQSLLLSSTVPPSGRWTSTPLEAMPLVHHISYWSDNLCNFCVFMQQDRKFSLAGGYGRLTQTIPSYRGTRMCTRNYPYVVVSLLIFSITNWDCVVLTYVDISTLKPPMGEVVALCPPAHNNSGTRSWVIYVGVVNDPSNGTTHACFSSSSKLMVRVSIICHHLQDVTPPQMSQSGWCRSCSLPNAYHLNHRARTQRLFVYTSARQDDVGTTHFFTATTTSTSTSATSASRGCHLYVVLIDFYSSHSIHTITTLQLWGMSAHQILHSTYFSISPSVVLPLWLQGC